MILEDIIKLFVPDSYRDPMNAERTNCMTFVVCLSTKCLLYMHKMQSNLSVILVCVKGLQNGY